MRILVLGGGGREHAIVTALSRSAHKPEIFCSPGNGGTAALAINVEINDEDPAFIAEWVERNHIDFVVVGPEAPLVVGVADMLGFDGVPVFGPRAAGAQIEGSKAFAKDLMERYDIPTGGYRLIHSYEEAEEYLREVGAPVVVKADGLAAGKGVAVAMTVEDALGAVRLCLDGAFGPAGELVVIEEFLEGPECSLLAFTDGETVLPMLPAQDHKRAYDNDEGPNTGGMGVYAPVPVVDDTALAAMTAILKQTVAALKSDGIDYRGVLYGGFILTDEGPKVLEFNARFGDPEAMNVLTLLSSDLGELAWRCVDGTLGTSAASFLPEATVCKYLVPEGYPDAPGPSEPIETGELGTARLYYSNVEELDGRLWTRRSRTLAFVGTGSSLEEAEAVAEKAAAGVRGPVRYRRDIGTRALLEQRCAHMRSIR